MFNYKNNIYREWKKTISQSNIDAKCLPLPLLDFIIWKNTNFLPNESRFAFNNAVQKTGIVIKHIINPITMVGVSKRGIKDNGIKRIIIHKQVRYIKFK